METASRTSDRSKISRSAVLSRRALLRGSGAAALAVGAATLVDEGAFAQEAAPLPAMRSPQHEQIAAASVDAGLPALPSAAVIAFGRMAFGATPSDWAAFQALGGDDEARLTAYVDQQLNPSAMDDSG